MLVKAILLGLVGVIGVIDSRLIGRQNIGRPLILSTLSGLVLGDLRMGMSGASAEAALTIAIPVAVIGEFMSAIMRIVWQMQRSKEAITAGQKIFISGGPSY